LYAACPVASKQVRRDHWLSAWTTPNPLTPDPETRGNMQFAFCMNLCSGSEAGSYLRFMDSCITQLKAKGPSRTFHESKEEVDEPVRRTRRRAVRSRGAPARAMTRPAPRFCERATRLTKTRLALVNPPPRLTQTRLTNPDMLIPGR